MPDLRSTWREALVERRHAGAGVDHEQDHVGFADGDLGLLAHPVFERAVGAVLVAGGIEDAEIQVADAALRPRGGRG